MSTAASATLADPGSAPPHRHDGAVGVSSAFGSFGELLQGVLPEPAGDFLVTLPVAQWTMATFRLAADVGELIVRPAHKAKSRRLAEMILDWAGAPIGGVLALESGLPEGKGVASSSADLVATARAVGNALQRPVPLEVLQRMLGRIEPTDGVLYPGIVVFDHRRVRLRRRLGSLPPMTIVAVDEGGAVDTVAFNRVAKPFSAADRREYSRLLDRLADAVGARDLRAVGAVATRSALMNQALNPKKLLDHVIGVCEEVGGLGVVATHSGTMLGILLDTRDPAYTGRISETVRGCSALGAEVSLFRSLNFD